MKKIITLVAVVALACTAFFSVAGAKGAGPLVVTNQSAYIEEGYEGDVWNGVCENVILSEDGTYVRTENTEIIHVSGNVVTYWTYTAWGTYEVTEDDGETKVVVLSAPTDVEHVMNGALTTVDDDDSLLEYFEEETIEIDVETSKFAYAE